MSTDSKELVKELSYQLDEQYESRRPERDRNAPISGADFALSRSVGAFAKATKKEQPHDHLERDGCQFIDSNYLLLDYIQLSPELREIVIVICGLSGGNYRDYTPIAQSRIGKRMGLGVDAVREKIEDLIRWQIHNKKAIIYVRKNDRDKSSHHFQTTEYLPIIIHYAAEFVRQIKSRGLPPVNRQQAITDRTEGVYEEISESVVSQMPEAQILFPRKNGNNARNVTPPQAKLNFIETAQDKIIRDFEDLRRRIADQGYAPQKIWEETLVKAEKAFFGY